MHYSLLQDDISRKKRKLTACMVWYVTIYGGVIKVLTVCSIRIYLISCTHGVLITAVIGTLTIAKVQTDGDFNNNAQTIPLGSALAMDFIRDRTPPELLDFQLLIEAEL